MSGLRKGSLALAGCLFIFMMVAVAPTVTAAPATGTLWSKIDPNKEYVVVNCINTIEYWNAHKYAWKKAGELFGVKTSWVGSDNDDTAVMVANLESVISRKPAGIVVLGWDEGLAPSINKAVAQGIPVCTFSGDVVTSNRDTWLGTNQHDLGYVGGKKWAESVGGKGKVAILTYPGKGLFDGRQKGFEDAFKEYPGIKVVAIGNTKTDPMVSIQAAKDILVRNPDLKGFVCCDATGAMGAVTAVKEAKLAGKVDILGLDRDSDTLNMIKKGIITGTVIQDDATMLYWAMFDLISANYYLRTALLSTDNKAAGAKLTPNRIETAINYVDKNNVDLYLAANKIYVAK